MSSCLSPSLLFWPLNTNHRPCPPILVHAGAHLESPDPSPPPTPLSCPFSLRTSLSPPVTIFPSSWTCWSRPLSPPSSLLLHCPLRPREGTNWYKLFQWSWAPGSEHVRFFPSMLRPCRNLRTHPGAASWPVNTEPRPPVPSSPSEYKFFPRSPRPVGNSLQDVCRPHDPDPDAWGWGGGRVGKGVSRHHQASILPAFESCRV